MAAPEAKQTYSRAEIRRLLKLSEAQLRRWEGLKLIAPAGQYGFKDLLALRAILKLRRARRPAAQIRRAIEALAARLDGVTDPLTELKLYAQGKHIHVEVGGRAMEAESGQLLLDFDQGEINRLLEFRVPGAAERAQQQERRASADRWFQQGLHLEQTGAPAEQIIEAYQKAVEIDPKAAGALVNLGTLYFHARQWREAEDYYRRALDADPNYALAHFDLANLYDERGERSRAIEHYRAALKIAPNYADAHYNLALLYQGSQQPMKAVHHWTTYLKLDRASQWATIARRELAKLRAAVVVPGSRT
jgi:tetratricopeptide (TPR) repeat protein